MTVLSCDEIAESKGEKKDKLIFIAFDKVYSRIENVSEIKLWCFLIYKYTKHINVLFSQQNAL